MIQKAQAALGDTWGHDKIFELLFPQLKYRTPPSTPFQPGFYRTPQDRLDERKYRLPSKTQARMAAARQTQQSSVSLRAIDVVQLIVILNTIKVLNDKINCTVRFGKHLVSR